MKKIGIDYDKEHFGRIEQYIRKIQRLYISAIQEVSSVSENIKNFDDSKSFSFEDYPAVTEKVNNIISSLSNSFTSNIQNMTTEEWLSSCYKNDDLVDSFSSKVHIPLQQLEKYKNRNLEALKAFQERKTLGLNLSEKVWKYTNQFKGELELGLDIGLGEGKSAAQLSRDLRSYLQDPDKLFRRVRDKRGNLQLSKNAKKYSPGQGKYRSSYKNAMRLTRTEINMAYRASDFERYKQLDFVIGFEVKRSNHVFACPLCHSLVGKYPKTFKFVGWHPQCRCFCIPILASPEEFISGNISKFSNEVTDLPESFTQWIDDNKDRINAAKQNGALPYFLRDNGSLITEMKVVPSKQFGTDAKYRFDEIFK